MICCRLLFTVKLLWIWSKTCQNKYNAAFLNNTDNMFANFFHCTYYNTITICNWFADSHRRQHENEKVEVKVERNSLLIKSDTERWFKADLFNTKKRRKCKDFLVERRPIFVRRSAAVPVGVWWRHHHAPAASLNNFSSRFPGRSFKDVLNVRVVENILRKKEFGRRRSVECCFCFVSSMLLSVLPIGLRLENTMHIDNMAIIQVGCWCS